MMNARRLRVLIIEDNPLIAEHVSAILTDAGFMVLGPVATNEDARAILDNPVSGVDAALLDLQLDRLSLMIADQLRGSQIPFVFATGNRSEIPSSYSDVPVCEKPFTPTMLLQALSMALQKNQS